jgi:hypothetical protein
VDEEYEIVLQQYVPLYLLIVVSCYLAPADSASVHLLPALQFVTRQLMSHHHQQQKHHHHLLLLAQLQLPEQ